MPWNDNISFDTINFDDYTMNSSAVRRRKKSLMSGIAKIKHFVVVYPVTRLTTHKIFKEINYMESMNFFKGLSDLLLRCLKLPRLLIVRNTWDRCYSNGNLTWFKYISKFLWSYIQLQGLAIAFAHNLCWRSCWCHIVDLIIRKSLKILIRTLLEC